MLDITTLISSVGFPIACCVAMGFYVNNTTKDMQKAIENNTKAITKLLVKLGGEEEDA